MTIRELMVKKLVDSGKWPDEAAAIMAKVEADTKEMAGRWDEDESGHPTEMLAVCLLLVTEAAKDDRDADEGSDYRGEARPSLSHGVTQIYFPSTDSKTRWR